jgi:hypothetical protein
MITLTPDPNNPDKLTLTATVTMYLDRLLTDVLSEEIATAIRERAIRDLQTNAAVRKQIAATATQKLLTMLGCEPPKENK